MKKKVSRNSYYIRPLTYIIDISIINLLAFLLVSGDLFSMYFCIFITLIWIIIAININFYEVYRFTKLLSILNKVVTQLALFTLGCFAFSGFYIKNSDPKTILTFSATAVLIIGAIKFLIFFSLKKYRSFFGGNFKRVIIVGNSLNTSKLSDIFINNSGYGCKLVQTYDYETNKQQTIDFATVFSIENNIDTLYFSLQDLSKKEIDSIIEFSENNLKTVKFIPERDEALSINYKIDYYGYVPIISLQKTTLHEPVTIFIKRFFDIFFSIIVIIFLLSWLVPILALLIKIESKGPAFFMQGRPGIDEQEFFCFKFRSMNINKTTETEASKNDPRVTRIGKFIRKTSIDELPQFFNVLLGDMSVVGPRPHLWTQNKTYGNRINKYMARHYVKPGITGLAQVNGFRGEIETDEDMISRVNYDIFYIENWSFFLDIKIIFLTVYNIFKGEEKAY